MRDGKSALIAFTEVIDRSFFRPRFSFFTTSLALQFIVQFVTRHRQLFLTLMHKTIDFSLQSLTKLRAVVIKPSLSEVAEAATTRTKKT
jgi:hypothetical protein